MVIFVFGEDSHSWLVARDYELYERVLPPTIKFFKD